jgi:hypothetical protein
MDIFVPLPFAADAVTAHRFDENFNVMVRLKPEVTMEQGLVLTIGDVVIGLVGAYGVTRVMANLLFGVSATDLMTFATVPIVLTATAMLAIYVPALRDPGRSSGRAARRIDSRAISAHVEVWAAWLKTS